MKPWELWIRFSIQFLMAFLWLGFGIFWLFFDETVPGLAADELTRHPAWMAFCILSVFYGAWRIFRSFKWLKENKEQP